MSADRVRKVLKGDPRALAALMTWIANDDPRAKDVLKAIYPRTGRAYVIGVTGAAGAGKSTLIDRMTAEYRRRNQTVGILAVDPSSLFSGGAVLGDRVRMRAHFADAGVFIRSFATRGATGGVSAPVRDAVHLLDAAGKDVIFVETIGVGQDELDIAALVHTVVLVLTPAAGDEVQAIKAGPAEIADIIALNKADLAGAEAALQRLQSLFGDGEIVAVSALREDSGRGLVEVIESRRIASLGNGRHRARQLRLCREELLALLRRRILGQLAQRIDEHSLDERVKRIVGGRGDPYSEAEEIARRLGF